MTTTMKTLEDATIRVSTALRAIETTTMSFADETGLALLDTTKLKNIFAAVLNAIGELQAAQAPRTRKPRGPNKAKATKIQPKPTQEVQTKTATPAATKVKATTTTKKAPVGNGKATIDETELFS